MRTLRIAFAPIAVLAIAWACAALWLDGPASRPFAGLLSGGFGLACLALLARLRPFGRALLGVAALFAVVLVWWLSLSPSNDRDWQPDVAHPPTAKVELVGG